MAHESWDVVREIEKADDQSAKERDHSMKEKIGVIGERLHHALRKDFNFNQDRVFLRQGIPSK